MATAKRVKASLEFLLVKADATTSQLLGKWGQSPQGPWRRVLEETSCQLNCCQIKKERRCRGLSGIVRFGKSMKAVVLVERDNGVVGINRDEPTSCPVVGKEEPFDEIKDTRAYSALLEFALYAESRHLYRWVESKTPLGKGDRFAVCAFHASAQNGIVAEINCSQDGRRLLPLLANYVCLGEQFSTICSAILCEIFIEVAVATVDACKNGGIDNQLKRKAAERESVSRRFHRVRLLHGSTCWLESDVWSANRRQSRRASSFRREGQYRRVAQSVLRLYPSTLELT